MQFANAVEMNGLASTTTQTRFEFEELFTEADTAVVDDVASESLFAPKSATPSPVSSLQALATDFHVL